MGSFSFPCVWRDRQVGTKCAKPSTFLSYGKIWLHSLVLACIHRIVKVSEGYSACVQASVVKHSHTVPQGSRPSRLCNYQLEGHRIWWSASTRPWCKGWILLGTHRIASLFLWNVLSKFSNLQKTSLQINTNCFIQKSIRLVSLFFYAHWISEPSDWLWLDICFRQHYVHDQMYTPSISYFKRKLH